MTESDLIDTVLNFENQCYNEGFQQGVDKGKKEGFVEGRELGIQTGFQRYLSLGILQGRSKVWKSMDLPEKPQKQVSALEMHVDITDCSNKPQSVEAVELAIKKGKNKAKLVAATLKSPAVEIHDNKIAFVRDDAIEDLS